jgi:hypothetical protein
LPSPCSSVGAFVLSTEPTAAQGCGGAQAPAFQVDQLWPKPLPNHWILGSVTGLAVDSTDHIWIVHRGIDSLTARTEAGTGTTPPSAEDCCAPAPPVLEFDAAGALVSHWGGPVRDLNGRCRPAASTSMPKATVDRGGRCA